MNKLHNQFNETWNLINQDIKISLLCEKEVTYYELRRFVNLVLNQAKKPETKKVLVELLKILAVLEMRKLPVPTIPRLKASSPSIFG